ncbi:MAG: segregation/condensation protein A [Spirochaetes bacterium]|nr:segregation/condensation protein A [Spirochaetota bacterium]
MSDLSNVNTPSGDGFSVKLTEYEGPLDYLIELVRRSEKNIYEISLVSIIEQFLAHIRTLQEHNLEVTSDFLVMAAELHLMKSRMLLPYDYGKDLKDREDPKFKLVQQLLEYQQFKLSAETLDELQQFEDMVIERKDKQRVLPLPAEKEDPKDAWGEVGLYELVSAFARLVYFVDKSELAAMEANEFSVADATSLIMVKTREQQMFSFFELLNERLTKRNLIIFFLAILELVTNRTIQLKQDKQFNEIYIFSNIYKGDAV